MDVSTLADLQRFRRIKVGRRHDNGHRKGVKLDILDSAQEYRMRTWDCGA
jgi:uncharacterized iron-regulated protein